VFLIKNGEYKNAAARIESFLLAEEIDTSHIK
jgi:hypothetical protein